MLRSAVLDGRQPEAVSPSGVVAGASARVDIVAASCGPAEELAVRCDRVQVTLTDAAAPHGGNAQTCAPGASVSAVEVKKLGLVGLGFVAGIAFVVACPSSQGVMPGLGSSGGSSTGGLFGSSTASAADVESECMQWEVQAVSIADSSGVISLDTVTVLPAGWAPFAADGAGRPSVLARRCAD